MSLFLLVTLILLGLGIGSFLNVVIYRTCEEDVPKFWQGRSFCPRCKHALSWKDNIPLLSFILLKGRCRYCHKKISWQYPIVELTTAVATVLVGLGWLGGLGGLGVAGTLLIVWAMIAIFFADVRYQLIPDEAVLVLAALGVLGRLGGLEVLGRDLVVGFLSALAFFAVVLATKFRGMGLGDVKLAFVMGLLLGFPAVLVSFWVAFISGGLFAVGLLLLQRKKIRDTIALGPFLVIGFVIAALWSHEALKLIGL